MDKLFPEPVVKLTNYFKEPYNNAIAAARTCYSAKGIVTIEEVSANDKARALRDTIARGVYKGGHHTVFQHSHFQFSLEKVSRHFVWSFIHSHPFYNSEQTSQRYVEVKEDSFTIPPLTETNKEIYLETVKLQMQAYKRLNELLEPTVQKEYLKIFPFKEKKLTDLKSVLKKKQQEVARYILPIATHTSLYHTISGLTLYRYYRLCEQYDAPLEQKIVIQNMVDGVKKIDPLFLKNVEVGIPFEKTLEYQMISKSKTQSVEFIKEFDKELGKNISKLIDYKINGEKTMAQAVRGVLGLPKKALLDSSAIDIALNPAKNNYLSDILNLNTLSKLTRSMVHPNFTFKKKLSHTADSQDQRHRMTPASRPVLIRQLQSKPDYIVPALIKAVPSALEYYEKTMKLIWESINKLLNNKAKEEYVLYLLPNAFTIRFEESGSLLDFHHKWTKRLCYLAQEEIWQASKEEVEQIGRKFPNIGKHILAPCYLRKTADITPYCPEGTRFCGVKVWSKSLKDYSRLI